MSDAQLPYVKPDGVDKVCDLLATHGSDAKVVAGGQTLSLLIRQDLLNPTVLVDISELTELAGIRVKGGRINIGATTTYSALADAPEVNHLGGLADAVDVIADSQVRNFGTIGGAIAHADPSLDILPPLLCLDATLELAGTDGRRAVAISTFYDGYMETALQDGEIIAAITIHEPPPTVGTAYEKYAKIDGGWAVVGVGSYLDLNDDGTIETARLALAAVDDTPIRISDAEAALQGKKATPEVIADAAELIPQEINPLEDLSGSVPYKEALSIGLGRRSLERSLDRAGRGELR